MSVDWRALREEYLLADLSEASVNADPIQQFDHWFRQAVAANLREPNAMTLATATPDGGPSARILLLKHLDSRGFVFYTSYVSRKAQELDANPRAAVVFYWVELERQVRIEGTVTRVDRTETEAYFWTRPRGSQLGAWASPQSSVIAGREIIQERVKAVASEFEGREVTAPPNWGGYRLAPDRVEFWQGRANRLHDRLVYRRAISGSWTIERLAP